MRLFVSHAFHNLQTAAAGGGEVGTDSQSVPEWELKIEGRLLDEVCSVSTSSLVLFVDTRSMMVVYL